MFTGIIEDLAIVDKINQIGSNLSFIIKSPIAQEIKIDQSISHNGICLTVEEIDLEENSYQITAIEETIQKTNISNWRIGDKINIERCLKLNDRLDGHIVQGHVDTTAKCISKENKNGSFVFTFSINQKFASFIIEKGSICINGVSLTLIDVQTNLFSVAIIPYTFEHTNFNNLKVDDIVNIEFDVVGKYIQRIESLKSI